MLSKVLCDASKWFAMMVSWIILSKKNSSFMRRLCVSIWKTPTKMM